MHTRSHVDRTELAQHRLRRVLIANTVATARTLEQKISDSGPSGMRIDPHSLTPARRTLEVTGEILYLNLTNTRWYHLARTPATEVSEKLAILSPLYESLQHKSFLLRLGQTLEIGCYRALIAEPSLHTLGAYPDMDDHDDSTLYRKEELPAQLSGRACTGKLDFVVMTNTAKIAGIEIKNVREWMYPDRDEVRSMLSKCTALDIIPVLIARRIPFVTFKLLHACGAIVHQTYNQLFPLSEAALAEAVKNKSLLGYHDVRLGNQPDTRLTHFISNNLSTLIDKQRAKFDEFKDLLQAFAQRSMDYAEFAARVRRRCAGTNENHD